MNKNKKVFIIRCLGLLSFLVFGYTNSLSAQKNLSVQEWQSLYKHGIEQYKHKHYDLAADALEEYLNRRPQTLEKHSVASNNLKIEEARYYLILSNLKRGASNGTVEAEKFVKTEQNLYFKQRVAFALAQYYFHNNELEKAIVYYEIAGVDNLSNEEVADAKFELAYSYFNNQEFSKAKPLFKSIKELPGNKYYIPGNYYYGLLEYQDKNYEEALKSFNRIEDEENYLGVIPYYKAEIYYFQGKPDRVLAISKKYLSAKSPMYYHLEMHLLTAQTYFEEGKYKEALPHFEEYYNNSTKIRKEELYEIAYTYYRLEKWDRAIEMFQPLSNIEDTLGQTSMYLLGDCYLKINDKKGARNAFSICKEMDFNITQKEAAMFLYAKLSYELGDEGMALKELGKFVKDYPNSEFIEEGKMLLSHLLVKNDNYEEAMEILNQNPPHDPAMWSIYQHVAVGRAMQLVQQKNYSKAADLLNLSLQQPNNRELEAIAYFWKSEIAYAQQNYQDAIGFGNEFIKLAQGYQRNIQEVNPEVNVANAYFNMGHAHLALNDYDKAQNAFALARKQNVNMSSAASAEMKADATLREADAYMMQRKYKEAAKLYDLVIQQGLYKTDYAKYQRAIIHGLENQNTQKEKLLMELINNQYSSYSNLAQLEWASMLLEAHKYEEAINNYKKVQGSSSASSTLKSKAVLGMALAYREQGRIQSAKEMYEQFLEKYPDSEEREYAMESLSNLYVAEGNPEAFFNYLRDNEIAEPSVETKENTFYDAAIRAYANMEFKNAEAGFTKYLENYPEGVHSVKAYYFRAESRLSLEKKEDAMEDFAKVLEYEISDYTEDAALKASKLAWSLKDFQKSYNYYSILKENAIDQELLYQAYLGMAKSSYELADSDEAYKNAEYLLQLPHVKEIYKDEANLIMAKVLTERGEHTPAMQEFKALAKKENPLIYAPARYYIAYISFKENKLEDAEKEAAYSAQNSGGQEYWTVNSYLLLAQILFESKDYFNAKALAQSIVKDPTKNEEVQALKKEAEILLDRIITIEKEESKLQD